MDRKQLLRKFLDKRCTEEELRRVETLLDSAEGKELLHRIMTEEAEQSGYGEDGVEEDPQMYDRVTTWLHKVHGRIAAEAGREPGAHNHKSLIPWKHLRIAAVWAGILLAGGTAVWQLNKSGIALPENVAYVEQTNEHGLAVRYLLPDSTEVYLAAGSRIRYPEHFGDKREMWLRGEAFFDVTPDPAKPFLIHTGSVQTRVLGTSFKVTAFAGKPLEVAVATGKVSVGDHRKGQIKNLAVLTAGRKASYDATGGRLRQDTVDVAALERWKYGEIRFEGQRLDTIVQELHRIYGADFRFADTTLAGSRVSATFSATEPLARVLDMLAFVGKFRYTRKSEKQLFTLYKE